jgi:hypothetical protein
VGSAELTDVQIEGFGAFGFLSVRSTVTWTGGRVSTNLGAGLEVWSGEATLIGVTIWGTRDGAGAIESFGAVFGEDARITSQRLYVANGDSFGLFHDGGSAAHEDLIARNNGFAAVWIQGATAFDLSGLSMIEDNRFAGVAALGSTGIHVQDASIVRTTEGVRVSGIRTVRAADGLHLVDSDGLFEDLSLLDNDRIGLLVDLGGGNTSAVSLTDVSVEASGTSLGAVAQNGTVEPGWDDGITRLGATATNDGSFTDRLEIAGAVGPVCFPPLDSLDTGGIQALVGL